MKITQILKTHFDNGPRTRAAAYTYGGAIAFLQTGPAAVQAKVRGTQLYDVNIRREDDALRMSCTCPYFLDRGDGCKHLWAVVQIAEQRGYLGDLLADPYVDVMFDDGASDHEPFDDDDVHSSPPPRGAVVRQPKKPRAPKKEQPGDWTRVVRDIQQFSASQPENHAAEWTAARQLLYVIDTPSSHSAQALILELAYQERKQDGAWGKPKFKAIPQQQAEQIREGPDAAVMPLLFGAQSSYGYYNYGAYSSRFSLSPARCRALLPLIGATGRLFARLGPLRDQITPLRWDDGAPWQLRLRVEPEDNGRDYRVTGWLCRGAEQRPVTQPVFVAPVGVAIWVDHAALLDADTQFAWLNILRKEKTLHVRAAKKDEFLGDLFSLRSVPPVDLPAELHVTEERAAPKPKIVIRPPQRGSYRSDLLEADVAFDYADRSIAYADEKRGIFDTDARRFLARDEEAERAAVALLREHGFRPLQNYYGAKCDFELPARLLPKATFALLEAGWHVEAEGKLYRRGGEIRIEVKTGIDWFDLEGDVRFDDQSVPLPRLLQALKKGEKTVRLDDGTFGMLPEDWLKKYGMLSGLGTAQGDQVRFGRMQAGLLDALLATMPEVSVDEAFRNAAQELRRFEGIKPVDPPAEFVGTLREYQREGLGWLHFLDRFGFGGCLADDMGLGKTVQVLALLANRAEAKKPKDRLPTLIVVPKSLVFNWRQEAERFAPRLKVLDHTGLARGKSAELFADFDLILTTYGTLRRDVLLFKDAKFDYCILDEAQVVKNASTEQAKATRLLQANHRLALSGTPVENHLGELWSLFEFLNPGMLGHASVFKLAGGAARNPDPETRAILAKGLRPFILRRTKQQVAKDLPDKTEQTLYCELEPEQRKLYDELRDHYRQALLKTIDAVGLNRAKIQVLEALLRLRQAACHPGLIDKNKTGEASAKLELLFPYLEEAIEGGQKTLVFSQFTSFLAILRARLDEAKIPYEYLDGKTRNRQEKVERFQNDPECKLFLISLKAGGLGLNLTAAEYVFLLDPWWNPAVEAQAIDRTHRIGQTKPVFAYRIIAKNTVEEKVVELQKTKRALADAILNADNSVMSNLRREDLEMLLS